VLASTSKQRRLLLQARQYQLLVIKAVIVSHALGHMR
jgi:hypothetical protein